MSLSIVILAAGQGKRMNSKLPKVLHRLAGKTLLEHVVQSTIPLYPSIPPIVIYGHQGEVVRAALPELNVTWVEQQQQLGTGHAALQALPHLSASDRVLILYGDVPLITTETLQQFIDKTPTNVLGIITADYPISMGLGRIFRDEHNKITRIIEEKDATASERLIKEINTGIYLVPAGYLQKWLPLLQNTNAQHEYYLTEIVEFAVKENLTIHSEKPLRLEEIAGINDCLQLAQAERMYQYSSAVKLMQQGVTLYDPSRLDVRGDVSCGHDVTIDINVILEGRVIIGNHCKIGANTVLRNVTLGDHVEIKENCVIDGADIAEHCIVGPFARVRPGTHVASHVHIGNFIEIKNSTISSHSKLNHVSYIGDSEIGKRVNIGAGTITCNYDGADKHKTIIGDDAFIGSNSSLVAPVTIGENATIGASSTITRDAPAQQLTLCRTPQRSIANWQRKKKSKQES